MISEAKTEAKKWKIHQFLQVKKRKTLPAERRGEEIGQKCLHRARGSPANSATRSFCPRRKKLNIS